MLTQTAQAVVDDWVKHLSREICMTSKAIGDGAVDEDGKSLTGAASASSSSGSTALVSTSGLKPCPRAKKIESVVYDKKKALLSVLMGASMKC